jgi:hypothetical protein
MLPFVILHDVLGGLFGSPLCDTFGGSFLVPFMMFSWYSANPFHDANSDVLNDPL